MQLRTLFVGTALAAGLLLADVAAAAAPRAALPKWEDMTGPPAPMDVWLRRLLGRYSVEGSIEIVYDAEGYDEHRCGGLPPDPNQQSNPPPPPAPYCSGIQGKVDCVSVGASPGVHCVLGVSWKEIFDVIQPDENMGASGAFTLPGFVPYLDPSMMLFGMDPGRQSIHFLVVDNKGLPEGGFGTITGDRATFRTTCVNGPVLMNAMKPAPPERIEGPPRECERILYIDARADSKVVHMMFDIEINDEVWTRYTMTLRRTPPAEKGAVLVPTKSR